MSAISTDFDDMPIPGDSIFAEMAACIPVIGTVVSIVEQYLINRQIDRVNLREEGQTSRMIRLIEVKNEYKLVGIVRGLLTIALLVAAAVAIPIAIIFVMPTIGLTVLDFAYYLENRGRIQQLTNGWPAYFRVY